MELNLIRQAADWPHTLPDLKQLISLTFKQVAIEPEKRSIAIVLTDNDDIQRLNRDFRGKDKPTNVLSFPSDDEDEWGDLIFAYETIKNEATTQKKEFLAHFSHLLVHGTLHLLGFDHEDDGEAAMMEKLEIDILAQLGIDNPYQNVYS